MSDTDISVLTPTIRGAKGLILPFRGLKDQTFKNFEWIYKISEPKEEGSDLNETLNEMIKESNGELIVFLQDFIKPNPEGLERFWKAYKNGGEFMTAPVGKIESKGDEPEWDWRKYPEAKINWRRWEIDWGACPREAIYDIGGFDEVLDNHWGFDNVNVGLRADMADYSFKHLPDNWAIAWDHDEHMEHPHRKKRNPKYHNMRLDDIRRGAKVDYLSKE